MKKMESRQKKPVEQLITKSKRVPLSSRVKEDTMKVLKAAAKESKTSVSDLAAAILDDYADWLKNQE